MQSNPKTVSEAIDLLSKTGKLAFVSFCFTVNCKSAYLTDIINTELQDNAVYKVGFRSISPTKHVILVDLHKNAILYAIMKVQRLVNNVLTQYDKPSRPDTIRSIFEDYYDDNQTLYMFNIETKHLTIYESQETSIEDSEGNEQ